MTNPAKLGVVDATTEITSVKDPFADLSSLRLSQSFEETVGVKKLLTTIPVRKPNQQDFIRVNPDPAFRERFPAIEVKDDRELFLVSANVAPELAGECIAATLYTAISRQGVVFFWPVRLPSADGRWNEWHRSAAEAAELAMRGWIRMRANASLGAYEIFSAEGVMQEPVWPNLPFNELLRVAFRDRIIDSLDHPVVKRLRGLA